MPEILFSTGSTRSWDPFRIEVWEHQGWNRFLLVFADTGAYPEPPGITTGNAIPFAAGDVDGDGLTDVVCINDEIPPEPDTFYRIVMTLESPDNFSYPCSLSWHYRWGGIGTIPIPTYFPPDLDADGHREILCAGTWIWENASNDSNELVWCNHECGGYFAFGDFDTDGRMDLATGGWGGDVWQNAGDGQYERVWCDTFLRGCGSDVFSTADIDRDGRPEFYVAYYSYPESKMWLCMYEDESDGVHHFTRTMVDSLTYWADDGWGRASAGGDIDGDGIDECIWTTYDSVRLYKAYGDDDLRQVWHWENDHHNPSGFNSLTTTVYDVNGDGYNELLLAGNAKISIFEVVAVDLLSPNSGTYNVGDTVEIRVATHTPPRCDSVSLFLRRDSLWHLSTIVTGLPASDDITYRWVVPANVPDTGRIVVIAYGPGRQFDMSDSAIHFIGGGVAEGTRNVPLQWSLSVSPNPARGALSVHYDVPTQTRVSVGVYDVDGRLVRSLSEGNVTPGRYEAKLPSGVLPAGVYFCTLDNGVKRISKKVVLAE